MVIIDAPFVRRPGTADVQIFCRKFGHRKGQGGATVIKI